MCDSLVVCLLFSRKYLYEYIVQIRFKQTNDAAALSGGEDCDQQSNRSQKQDGRGALTRCARWPLAPIAGNRKRIHEIVKVLCGIKLRRKYILVSVNKRKVHFNFLCQNRVQTNTCFFLLWVCFWCVTVISPPIAAPEPIWMNLFHHQHSTRGNQQLLGAQSTDGRLGGDARPSPWC